MPGLRLRLNKSSLDSGNPPPQALTTPRHAGGESSARDEWNRKRALKLKTSPPTSNIISSKLKTSPPTNSSISPSSYDSNDHEHHYLLSPLKISPSHELPPRLLYVNQAHHSRVSPKSALFIFMVITSFTVGTLINWKESNEGHPRCATFETMPQHSNNLHVNQHFRTLWSSNFKHSLPPFTPENEETLADMDKTGQSVNDSNDEQDGNDDSQPNKGVQKVTGNPKDCVPKASWQTTSYPTCNNIHEIDFVHSVGRKTKSRIFAEPRTGRRVMTDDTSMKTLKQKQEVDLELKGQGWFRTAWAVDRETSPFKVVYDDDEWDDEWSRDEQVVLKTLRIERDFAEEFYELHRRDAMAMERLTQSPYVLDVYGYCGQSTMNEFASHGTLQSMIKYGAHKKHRLNLAYEVAKGVSDVHSIDYADFIAPSDESGVSLKRSNATMVHYDLNYHNIAVVDGRYPKLNDFNVAMFLSWDPKKEATCGFEGRFREPWWRSPEEMQNHIEDGTEDIPLTEKVDVYSLGNILWSLLTNKSPWVKVSSSKVMDELRPRVARGEMPPLPSKIANSIDPTIVAIRNAMFKCLRLNPEERASAGEVAYDLKMAMKEIKRLEKEEKKQKKEAEKAAKLAEEQEKKRKEAEEIASKAIEESAALEPEMQAGIELMAQSEQQEGVGDTATEVESIEVADE